jgi:uncharacterized protein YndB with AHSA1/START domain
MEGLGMDEDYAMKIERTFNAPREKIWEAWTDPKILMNWHGPEGFVAPSIKSDFRVGGRYIYAMRGPEGSEYDKELYSAGTFNEIVPNEKIVATDYFSDEVGNSVNPEMYGMNPAFPKELIVTTLFEDIGDGKTKITILYPKTDDEEQMDAMRKSGMEKGWHSSLNKLQRIVEEKED